MHRIPPRALPACLAVVVCLPLAAPGGCSGSSETALGSAERCDNDADDDGDGFIDCLDPDCDGHLACDLRYVELQCDNHLDDDGDGKVDCVDPDCASQQACNPNRELVCNDGVDDDDDGLIDCRDPDCAQAGNCQEHCSDEVDNDGDGLIDCLDPDCATTAICLMERCGNGLDDDGDQLVDCADPDCAEAPNCLTAPPLEHCDNGADDDGDGEVDCADPDCATNPLCVEVFCNDGLDNDGNSLVDCEEQACLNDPACQLNTTCQGALPLTCGSTFIGTTRGRRNTFSQYPCLPGGTFLGGERFFVFTNSTAEPVSLYLTLQPYSSGTTLVLVGLPGTASGCVGTSCMTSTDTGTFNTTIPVPHGQTAYLVVDSEEAAGGDFHLSLSCIETPVEICNNGEDDDNDTRTDCMDFDCAGHYTCDYWISAGIRCELNQGNEVCAPGERCLPVQVGSNPTASGICTQTCISQGSPTTGCENPNYTHGACIPFASEGYHCVMECGTQLGTTSLCPAGTLCTDQVNGSTDNVALGICAPYP